MFIFSSFNIFSLLENRSRRYNFPEFKDVSERKSCILNETDRAEKETLVYHQTNSNHNENPDDGVV